MKSPHIAKLLAGSLTLLSTGCMVGPDYKGPPQTLASGQGFARAHTIQTANAPLEAQWWLALQDPELNRLEAAAIASSPDLAAATARVREARGKLASQRVALRPTTGTSAAYLHLHSGTGPLAGLAGSSASSAGSSASADTASSASSSEDLDFYNAGFDASWEIDLFGGQRRAVEGAAASAEAQIADLADAQVSLTADLARAYVSLRDVQRRAALARKSAALEKHMVDLARQRLAGGTASALDVDRLDTQYQQTETDIPPLDAQVDQQLDQIAILTGQAPGALDDALAAPMPVPMPPQTVAIGDPASLLRRRPDIREAERQIAASNAAIGQHIADYFPKLQLLGDVGFSSSDIGQLFNGASFSAIVAPVLQWKPFDFGRTGAAVAQARASRDEAEANYRSTVLKALNDAENALSQYGHEQEEVAGLLRVLASADSAARLTRARYDGGTTTLTDVLDTERQRVEAEQSLAQAEAVLTEDFIVLEKSLGLGWQSPTPAPRS